MTGFWDWKAALASAAVVAMIQLSSAAAENKPDSEAADNIEMMQLIDEAEPDVAFLVRLSMMRGHLGQAVKAIERGHKEEAMQHMMHPISEILPAMGNEFQRRKLNDPAPALKAALETLAHGDMGDAKAAILFLIQSDQEFAKAIDLARSDNDSLAPDTAVLLMRSAVVEYAAASEYGKIIDSIEYHDGSAFIDEAINLLLVPMQRWKLLNPATYEKLDRSLTQLQEAWPGELVPDRSVLSLTRMLALVTIIELQINRLRSSH